MIQHTEFKYLVHKYLLVDFSIVTKCTYIIPAFARWIYIPEVQPISIYNLNMRYLANHYMQNHTCLTLENNVHKIEDIGYSIHILFCEIQWNQRVNDTIQPVTWLPAQQHILTNSGAITGAYGWINNMQSHPLTHWAI